MSDEILAATVADAVDKVQCQNGIFSIEELAGRILTSHPEMDASPEDVLVAVFTETLSRTYPYPVIRKGVEVMMETMRSRHDPSGRAGLRQ